MNNWWDYILYFTAYTQNKVVGILSIEQSIHVINLNYDINDSQETLIFEVYYCATTLLTKCQKLNMTEGVHL